MPVDIAQLRRTLSFRLDGKRALVTGAGRGIGLAAAAALTQAGAHVTLLARSEAEITAGVAAVRAEGGLGANLVLDVSDPDAVQAEVRADAPFGILVNNAGLNRPALFQDVTVGDFDMVMGRNPRSAFFVASAVARRQIEAALPGSIIPMSSRMGHVGGARRTVYCASKNAVEGHGDRSRAHAIHVNTICPTFIETPMTRPFFNEPAIREDVLKRIKLGRVGQVEDLMGAIVFLASDTAKMMTGSSVVVDGGWSAE